MNKLTAEKCRYRIDQLKAWGSINNRGITAREEDYIQALEIALPILEQQERGGGWIEWGGGVCPVVKGTLIDVRYRDGKVVTEIEALCKKSLFRRDASSLFWKHHSYENDIIAYRIIPEQPTNQNGE